MDGKARRMLNRGGFTIPEVLIVLAIIAILTAVIWPIVATAHMRGRKAACSNNLKQLYLAFAMYAGDHDGYLPPYPNNKTWAQDQPGSRTQHFPPRADLLVASLQPYAHDPSIWFCPEDSFAHQDTSLSTQAGLFVDHRYSSYETAWPFGMMRHPATMSGVIMATKSKPIEIVPTDFVVLFDEQVQAAQEGWAYSHNGQFNFLHLDGHVRSSTVTLSQ